MMAVNAHLGEALPGIFLDPNIISTPLNAVGTADGPAAAISSAVPAYDS